MGSVIKINDTLKISKGRGFPKELVLDAYKENPKNFENIIGQVHEFWNKDERLYHRPPTRVFLVEEIDGKWLYWGHALIVEQTIYSGKTKGKYKLIKLYNPEYQRMITNEESPNGKSLFL